MANDESVEQTVRQGFWPKMRKFAGRVPFADDAVAAYYAALDKDTSLGVKATLLGALAYFIMPVDLIPDFVALAGFTDDAAVLAMALASVRGAVKPEHEARARAALGKPIEAAEAKDG